VKNPETACGNTGATESFDRTRLGTISPTGLYTAPAVIPRQNPVAGKAVSKSDSSVMAMTYLYLLTAGPTITAVTPNPIPVGTVTLTVTGTGILAGATIMSSGVQYSTSGTPTATSVTAVRFRHGAVCEKLHSGVMQPIIGPRFVFATLALLAGGCARPPVSPLADLAAKLPADAIVLAGADLDRLRSTPLFVKLPDALRDGSYVLAAYSGKDLTTATRSARGVTVSGAAGQGAPEDLLKRAPDAPLWLVARGNVTLPLAGNLANINRLLHQTQYAVVSARPGERFELRADAFCRSDADAQRLEENVRAIGSLTRFPLEVAREGATVRVTASVAPEVLGKLF
jgi:hypothetical protein